jgi:hypothetical protein
MAYTEFRMTLLVEVKPDVERELAAQAACRGMDVTAYAASPLEQAARPGRAAPAQANPLRIPDAVAAGGLRY